MKSVMKVVFKSLDVIYWNREICRHKNGLWKFMAGLNARLSYYAEDIGYWD